jgi:hypothetical protein
MCGRESDTWGMVESAAVDRAPDPPDVAELRRRAEALVTALERSRAGPRPVELRVRSRWARLRRFPTTVRRFERVFACQGEPWRLRWHLALRLAWGTLWARRTG